MAAKPYHHGNLRSALLAAGEQELTLNGVEGFSLRAVAKRAGVSHAAPAHHFGDMAGLLTALAAEGFRRFNATLEEHEAGTDDPRERAVRAGLGYIDFAITRPALFKLIFAAEKPDFAVLELQGVSEEAYQHLVGLIEGLGGGPRDVAALWAMSHGLADLARGQRLRMLSGMGQADRIAAIRDLLGRVLPGRTG